MSNKAALQERIRARRARMKDTTDLDGESSTGDTRSSTWAATMEEEESSIERVQQEDSSVEVEDEVEQSKHLVDTLAKRRKRTQNELSKALKSQEGEDVSEQMNTAKHKTKQHILEESVTGAETAASADDEESGIVPPLAILPTDDGGEPSSSKTPRADGEEDKPGVTPRKVSMAASQSMRARLTQRLKAAKEKGKDAAYVESSTRMLTGLRSLQRTTRFDDSAMIQEDELDADIQKSLTFRSKWKEAAEKTQEKSMLPTQEEAVEFFTGQWEPEEEAAEEAEQTSPPTEEQDEEPTTSADQSGDQDRKKSKKTKKKKNEDEEPLLEELDLEEDAWKFYAVSRAEYKPFHDKMKEEDDIYYVPSMISAPIEEKIFGEDEPRYLEEEGFYVGTRPNVPPGNLHRMENRLLRREDKAPEWFGEDGQLIALPDPLKEISYRPPVHEDIEPALQTDYIKAKESVQDGRVIHGSNVGQGHYQLDIDINTIELSHHHLYSREHVLASRLMQLCQQYLSRSRKNAADYLVQKMKALQSASAHVQHNISVMEDDNKTSDHALMEQQHRLKEYTYEIKQTRKQRDDEFHADRQLSRHIIQTWKDVKQQRQLQQFTNTTVKLQITKEPTNKAEDEEEWQQDIEGQLQEQRQEQEEEQQQQLELYKQQLHQWKQHKMQKKDAHKREKERRKRQSQGEDLDDEDEDLVEKDRKVLALEPIPKPDKPNFPTDVEARDKLLHKYNEIRRKPGEPKLFFELSHGATITPNNACPRAEQQRRHDVSQLKVFVRVLFNNKQVSQTSARVMGQDFVVRFAQIFNIEIMQWPEVIKLEICESSGLGSTMLSEVYAAIPESHITTENVQLDDVQFSSDIVKSHNHTGVGCGIRPDNNKTSDLEVIMMTSGHLRCSVAWAIDSEGNVMVPPSSRDSNQTYHAMKAMDAVAAIGVSGMADMDKLTKWISESHLDPNDPTNAELMYLMRPVMGEDTLMTGLHMPQHFRLEQLQEEFNFTTDHELDRSRRFRMIQLREKEEAAFRSKTVPVFDSEIPDELFTEYEKEKNESEKLKTMDQALSHRVAVAKFMQQVREQVMTRFRILSHQKLHSDMIFEDAVPNIGTIIPNLMKIAEPRRPLKPPRKERKKATAQNMQSAEVKLLVNIGRAYGIPVRADSQASSGGQAGTTTAGRTSAGIKNIAGEVQVRPYVEVMFQRNTQATSVADGPNPSWNEELSLPFKPPNNDFSSTNLQTIKDVLYFNLFDEYIVNIEQDDRERGSNIHRRIDRRWLGSLKIPFTTIYFNARIDGTFCISKPPVLLGYAHENRSTRTEVGLDFGVGDSENTYLTMFVTIEPKPPQPDPVREKFDTNEDEKLMLAADKWLVELEKKYPKREYKTSVVDINGKSVFITRYFRSLQPPSELLTEDDAKVKSERVARYVSLIPFVSDSVVFSGLCDIWSTCDQFLQMLQGDEEEHAVLLTNYFLSMGKKAYLLLGSAIPEGPTAYVLTQEGNDYWIWNAATGQHFSYRDNYCPVTSVGCLVNADNIWANMQVHDLPSQVTFDLGSVAHWRPFFHKGFVNPGISSVQPSELLYFPTEQSHVLDLQEKIERTLKEKIMEWRPRYVTRWNRYCVQAFRRLLVKLEDSQGRAGVQQQHSQELEQILGSYKLSGFPVNLPYTEMEPIIDSVFATGVHNYESSDVEFAIAVHIHPYPNSVLSVWVYVANLVRKR